MPKEDKVVVKPCPCCANKGEVIYDDFGAYYVECTICGLSTPRKATMEAAVAVWDRRELKQTAPAAEPGTYEYYIKKMTSRNMAIFLYRFWKTWYQHHGELNGEAINRIEDWLTAKRRTRNKS